MLGSALILTLTSLHITGCFAGPRDGEARKAHLLWTTDLRNVGYSANEPSRLGSVDAHLQLAFGSASELVVLNDQGPFGKPNEARAFVLSVVSGEVVNQKKWMTETWPFVFATAKGGYVAVTDQGMDLYSSGLKQVVASSPESARLASPDGAIVAAWSSELKPGHGLTLFLDTETLKPTGTEVLNKNVESVSRSHAAYVGYWAKSRNAIVFFVPEDDKLRPYNTSCQEIRPKNSETRSARSLSRAMVLAWSVIATPKATAPTTTSEARATAVRFRRMNLAVRYASVSGLASMGSCLRQRRRSSARAVTET